MQLSRVQQGLINIIIIIVIIMKIYNMHSHI